MTDRDARAAALRESLDPPALAAATEGVRALSGVTAEAAAALDGSARGMLAMLLAVYLVHAADGEVKREESAQLATLLRKLSGDSMDPPDVEHTIGVLAETLERDGYDACFARVGAAIDTPALRLATFKLAVGAALVDGVLAEEEAGVVTRLAHVCGLTDDDAERIVEELEEKLG